jgi:hypothetical protein
MLPIYEAVGFERVMLGGTTRPWLVNVLENGKPVPYVVKLYTEKYNEENCSVLKEAICSYLASEFEIEVPEPALINFSQNFLDTLPTEQREELARKDQRIKFGCRLIDAGYENFSPQLSSGYLKDYDIGTIYAFDNLILNHDRRTEKPNLFFRDGRVVLIDHEHTFTLANGAADALLAKRQWPAILNTGHLFFQYLVKLDVKAKEEVFDSFQSYLETMIEWDGLSAIQEQLERLDHPIGAYFDIRDYLRVAEAKSSFFRGLIERSING